MDERSVKRLLAILLVSFIVIFVFKNMMTNTIVNLNKAAVEKQKTSAMPPSSQQESSPVSDAAIVIEAPAVSSVGDVSAPSVASGVNAAQ